MVVVPVRIFGWLCSYALLLLVLDGRDKVQRENGSYFHGTKPPASQNHKMTLFLDPKATIRSFKAKVFMLVYRITISSSSVRSVLVAVAV